MPLRPLWAFTSAPDNVSLNALENPERFFVTREEECNAQENVAYRDLGHAVRGLRRLPWQPGFRPTEKPNILVIWGDDIGTWNISHNNRGISGQDEYSDGMVEHDRHVGEMLSLIDELGLAKDTLVIYSTDNGPHYNTWPDAGKPPGIDR